jgi:hypothetical protein
MPDTFITLDANMPRALADRALYAEIMSKPVAERAAAREKEIASGDGDFTRLSLSEGRFIDLAIHKDTFLDDIAVRSDVDFQTPVAWKTRYEPVVGVLTGSVYGLPPRKLYQTQDNSSFLTSFTVDAEEVTVPKLALTQDPERLGQRTAGLARQAEALKLQMETFLANVVTGQTLGTSLATSFYNYATGSNPYTGKTVYIADPGVQTGTYETSNIIDGSAEAGFTPTSFDLLITQLMLTGRQIRTIHVPKRGLPWKKLIRYATIVANASSFSAGQPSNPNLAGIPAEEYLKLYRTDMTSALEGGLIVSIFGHTFKLKANNSLAAGVSVVTTDQPAAEFFNVTGGIGSYSYDIDDPRNPFFTAHGEKRQIMIAAPDPWVRNWFCFKHDTPAL